jgi:cytochrome P450
LFIKADVDDVADEQILCTDNLPKASSAYTSLHPVIGSLSIITLEGEQWKRMRKLFNPAFASSYIETMIPAIIEESQVFVGKLESVVGTEKVVRTNIWLNVRPMILLTKHLMIDIISKVMFSIRLHSQLGSVPMIEALDSLLKETQIIDPLKAQIAKWNPYRYYRMWRDERFPIPLFSCQLLQ